MLNGDMRMACPTNRQPMIRSLESEVKQGPAASSPAQGGFEPPVGPTETLIARAWQQILKVERIGRHDNFFERGGGSLQTLHVVHTLKTGGIEVQLADLFTHQTVAGLAAHLSNVETAAGNVAPVRDVVPIRESGTDTPLFLIHELTGSLVYAHVLAAHIDQSIPVFGLPPVKADKGLPPLEEMARQMVQTIARVAGKDSPCRLAGWSFGGLVAYEVARQLISLDRRVEFLGLIDTHYKSDGGAVSVRKLDDNGFLLVMLRMANAGHDDRMAQIEELAPRAADMDFTAMVEWSRERSLLPYRVAELPSQDILRVLMTMRAAFAIEEAYTAAPIAGPIHLFVPAEGQSTDPLRGWGAVVPEVAIHVTAVSGNHLTLMDPAKVGSLGIAMTQAILGPHHAVDAPVRLAALA
jgi:thioesterase domain-containing protein/aryl carrier-like protein